jgi:hypothetical protein
MRRGKRKELMAGDDVRRGNCYIKQSTRSQPMTEGKGEERGRRDGKQRQTKEEEYLSYP